MNHRIALMTFNLAEDEKRVYRFMAKALSGAGWRIEIINPVFEGQDSQRIYFRKSDVRHGGFLKRFAPHRTMMKSLLESRADIAVLCDAELLKMLPKAKRIMPIQIIFDMNGTVENNYGIFKRKLLLADAVITENEETADKVSELYGRTATAIRGEIDKDLLISLCDELERGGRYNI